MSKNIISEVTENFFFLVMSTKMAMTVKDTKHHLKEIQKKYIIDNNCIYNYSIITKYL